MKILTVFRYELKKCGFIVIVALCSLLCACLSTSVGLSDMFDVTMGWGYFYPGKLCTDWLFLPVSVLLALCLCRDNDDTVWRSMPFTANELYLSRLAFGALFIAATGLVKLVFAFVAINGSGTIARDLYYLGYDLSFAYDYPSFLLTNIGAFVISYAACMLTTKRIAAAYGLFLLVYLDCKLSSGVLDVFNSKAFGMYINEFTDSANTAAALVYAAITAVMLAVGLLANAHTSKSGSGRLFCCTAVKVIYVLLTAFFVCNVIKVSIM